MFRFCMTVVVVFVMGLFVEHNFKVVEHAQLCCPYLQQTKCTGCDCDNCGCCKACPSKGGCSTKKCECDECDCCKACPGKK